MARQRFIYRQDRDGETRRIEVAPSRKSCDHEDYRTRMRKTLYQLECDEGSRFSIPGYSNKQLEAV